MEKYYTVILALLIIIFVCETIFLVSTSKFEVLPFFTLVFGVAIIWTVYLGTHDPQHTLPPMFMLKEKLKRKW